MKINTLLMGGILRKFTIIFFEIINTLLISPVLLTSRAKPRRCCVHRQDSCPNKGVGIGHKI